MNDLLDVLKRHIPGLPRGEPLRLEQLQQNTYRLDSQPAYFLKVIADDDLHGQNELQVNQDVLARDEIPRPELRYRLKVPRATIACWEWLEGSDLRLQGRNLLLEAFGSLGRFHARQRHTGPVESPVTQKIHKTVPDLLEAEMAFLTRHHEAVVCQAAGKAADLLGVGYATIIHGDMHPGNLRLVGTDIYFVDWGYCIPSLNLFDLGYIETIDFEDPDPDDENAWWLIKPAEARAILQAYYEACGLHEVDYERVQVAVMFWSKLWAHENSELLFALAEAARVKKHLAQLAEML